MEELVLTFEKIQKRKQFIQNLESEEDSMKDWVIKFKRRMLELEYEWILKLVEVLQKDMLEELGRSALQTRLEYIKMDITHYIACEHTELYALKKLFNYVCEDEETSTFKGYVVVDLQSLIVKKYKFFQHLLSILESEMEQDFGHVKDIVNPARHSL